MFVCVCLCSAEQSKDRGALCSQKEDPFGMKQPGSVLQSVGVGRARQVMAGGHQWGMYTTSIRENTQIKAGKQTKRCRVYWSRQRRAFLCVIWSRKLGWLEKRNETNFLSGGSCVITRIKWLSVGDIRIAGRFLFRHNSGVNLKRSTAFMTFVLSGKIAGSSRNFWDHPFP